MIPSEGSGETRLAGETNRWRAVVAAGGLAAEVAGLAGVVLGKAVGFEELRGGALGGR